MTDQMVNMLALSRKRIPGVVSHNDTRRQKSNDAGESRKLSTDVRSVAHAENDEALDG